MPTRTVAVQTLEPTNRPVVIGLEVGCAAVDLIRVVIDPRACDVVLAFPDGALYSRGSAVRPVRRCLPGELSRPDRHLDEPPARGGCSAADAVDCTSSNRRPATAHQLSSAAPATTRPSDTERRHVLAVHRHWQPCKSGRGPLAPGSQSPAATMAFTSRQRRRHRSKVHEVDTRPDDCLQMSPTTKMVAASADLSAPWYQRHPA